MKEAKTYRQQGFLTAKSIFSPSEIGNLTKIVDRIHRQWLAENHAAYLGHGLVNMHSLTHPRYFEHHAAERLAFFRLLASDRLTNLLSKLFDDGLYFHNTQLFFNPHQDSSLPYWHRDLQYSPIDDASLKAEQGKLLALHIRIPLIPETGIELIPGTHRRWDNDVERDVRLELNGHKNSEPLPDSVTIRLKAGDILIFDAQMLHRGNYRLNPSRKALDLCVGKTHPFMLPFLDASTLPTPAEMEGIENPHWYEAAHASLASSR